MVNRFFIGNFFLLSAYIFLTCQISYGNSFSTPITPAIPSADKYIGIVVGVGQNMQNGTAFVDCDSCFFKNGVDFGFTIGINYEANLSSDEDSFGNSVKLGAMLLYDLKNIKSSFREKSIQYFSEYNTSLPINVRHTDKMSISAIELMPYFTYNPFSFAFIRLGLNASYLLTNNMEHTMELIDKTTTLSNGEKKDIYIPTKNPNKKLYSYVAENGEIKDINKFGFGLQPAIGFDIDFSDKIKLSTSFNYMFPLTKTSEFGENFTISEWRILLEFKYNLKGNTKKY